MQVFQFPADALELAVHKDVVNLKTTLHVDAIKLFDRIIQSN